MCVLMKRRTTRSNSEDKHVHNATLFRTGRTRAGDFPTSCSVTRARLTAEARTMARPVAVDPVKAILSTPGWLAKAAPAVAPWPVTTLNTPFGKIGRAHV